MQERIQLPAAVWSKVEQIAKGLDQKLNLATAEVRSIGNDRVEADFGRCVFRFESRTWEIVEVSVYGLVKVLPNSKERVANAGSGSLPRSIKDAMGLEGLSDLRWSQDQDFPSVKYVTPFIRGVAHFGRRLRVGFDPAGGIRFVQRPHVSGPVGMLVEASPNFRQNCRDDVARAIAASGLEGFFVLQEDLTWVTRNKVTSMMQLTEINAVDSTLDSRSYPFGVGFLNDQPSKVKSLAVIFNPQLLNTTLPTLSASRCASLASRVLVRGATMLRCREARKSLSEPQRECYFGSKYSRDVQRVMILDRGRKLCLIGRLDPDGEGIQVTIQGKDYHWMVKPEWFEK